MHLFMPECMYTYVSGCSLIRSFSIKNSFECTGEPVIKSHQF